MFNVIYDPLTGAITQYQEGGTPMVDASVAGLPQLSFANPIAGMFNEGGQLCMKVDINTKKLVLLNPIEIPDPLPNPTATIAQTFAPEF